ncbi:MAG: ADP-forming succinate--CoA ligase subunit beta [Chlamydiales bacterium]|nr:ADP-forming succinate--CoA ligase subunit beta [Chlamydiales bacterium]
MNIHEYQAKEILSRYHIPIPPFGVAGSVKEVEQLVKELGLKEAVIKIQVHAGGRGKAGGVKFAKTPQEIASVASKLIGMKMVNNQTGKEGVVAHKVLVSKPLEIKKEYYLGAVIDRDRARPVLIASPEGGVEIEEVAEAHPEKILTLPIGFDGSMKSFHLLRLCNFMGWSGETAKQGRHIAQGVAKAFIENDGSLLEINPLVEDPEGNLWALDAKFGIDDNALFRHPHLAAYYDSTQYSKNEVMAKEFDLAYIALDGTIGCMVNGAGLAMATMDIINYYGMKPANFLDVGGSATKEKISEGFKILLLDPQVKGILVNIFGGIMNCATLAEGIIHAASELALKVPLIVRMEGTHVEEGKRLLKESGLPITTADTLEEAAKKSVAAVKGV